MILPRLKPLCTAAMFLAGICLFCNSPASGQKAASATKARAEAPPASGKVGEIGPQDDPVVTALLASNPKTPSETFKTGQLLLEAGRPELAKRSFRKLLDSKPDDSQWSALVEEYHTTAFIDLAERDELRPENEEMLRAALGAANRQLRDPARLATEIKQLQDPSAEVRDRALQRLHNAHDAAVEALIAVLADPQRAGEHAAARHALATMRAEAIDPLADIIERADPEFTVEAVRALAEMRASQAIVYLYVPALAEESDVQVRGPARAALKQLLGSVPTPAQAARRLSELARSYFAGKQEMQTDVNGRVTLWTWDAAAKRCVGQSCPPDDASRAFAARLARAASTLAPNNRAAQALAVATELEQMVYDRGLDKGLEFDNAEVKRLAALEPRGHRRRACALPRRASCGRRCRGGRNPRPLRQDSGIAVRHWRRGVRGTAVARAVQSPDARLRIAACEAIARLEPKASFPGSSFVLDALAFQAASTGGRRALAVSPSSDVLDEWIGTLKFRNVESDAARSGKDALRMAVRCPDYELAVIDMATQSPPAEEIVQRFARTVARPGCESPWWHGRVSSSGPSGSPRQIPCRWHSRSRSTARRPAGNWPGSTPWRRGSSSASPSGWDWLSGRWAAWQS